ncbi:MAG: HAMP domain-containing histidine kinase [Clostridia bacterium]|nr:HAMP domain-containing histidine kinase [Clostridia bacterium]
MATKWKKSKAVKLISSLLMVVMAFVLAFSTLQCAFTLHYATDGDVVGDFADLMKNGKPSFFACPVFQNHVINQISRVDNLFNDPEQYRKELESVKESKVQEIVSAYASQKADIIKKELEYIAQNYERQEDGESIYNENGYSEILDSQIPEVPYENQKYIVDPYASKTVQMVQKILNYAEGTEFLKYASIVRYESFNESEFSYDTQLGYYFHCCDYTDTVEEIESQATVSINSYIQTEYDTYKGDLQYNKETVKNFANLKYYVKKGDTVYTNMQSPENELALIKTQQFYLVKENDEMLLNAGTYYHDDLWIYEVNDYKNMYKGFDEAAFYIGEDIVINGEDQIGELYKGYLSLPDEFDFTFFCAVVSLISLIFLCVIVFSCAGHKKSADGCTMTVIDKLPADIHLALSGGAIFGVACLVIVVLQEWWYFPEIGFTVFISACFAVAFALLIEFVTSIVRIKKAKQKILRNCIIIKLIMFISKGIAKFFKWIFGGVRKTFFAYKMKHLQKKFILFAVLWVLINIGMIVFIGIDMFGYDGIFGIISALLLLVFDGATIFFVSKYMNTLDKIIVAATEHTSANLYGERLPQSLTTLNESLKITKAEMDEAVAQAVKNERTKTELITNVSHDLKTPLTSIISYVDLLKKCDIKDEEALKYIDVLSDKSLNLKSLIENLIEASKASTGNIKINKVYLNLKELSAQAIGEFQSDFDARDLELRFKEDCDDVRVFADGPHTYRVLENLLSNAKKYSAKGTRVYASIRREGNFGVFELKNISKDPLNISPDELTERFVRGDASRGSEEGNGLGLSIAKQLCSLQGGELKLSIDGDLFKATVYLPIN